MHAVKCIFIKYKNTITNSNVDVKGRRLRISKTAQITFKEYFDNYVNMINHVIHYKIKRRADGTKMSK